jgi:GT2 family glycosyltransferase
MGVKINHHEYSSTMIVIAYSFAHFHPKLRPEPRGSAGTIAKTVYDQAVKAVGEQNVLYVDSDIPQSWGPTQSVATLIARASNFSTLIKHFSPQRNLLIAVNQHPNSRKNLTKQARKLGLPKYALNSTDGILESGKQISLASKVLIVGNGVTRQTYLENGFESRNVFPVAYKPTKIDFTYKSSTGNNILAHIGSIGFRKGADIIFQIADSLRESKLPNKLILTGTPVNEFWSEKLNEAIGRNPDNLEFKGWVDTASKEFKELLGCTKIAIFPSREEGLSGAFLEVANTGIPILTTDQVGIEALAELVAPIGKEFTKRLHELLGCTLDELEYLSENSRKWFDSVANSESQLRDTVDRFIDTNKVWPKVDLKLCVHNKAQSIENLILGWSVAASLTDNTSITVIDDGSKDQSSDAILIALRNSRGFSDQKFFQLPDVFEVKSNNAAIAASDSDYHVIVQDDNHIISYDLLPEMVALADKNRRIAALGGLAGVNFYPKVLQCQSHSPGQHACNEFEHYWRQDSATNQDFIEMYFEADAVMRGPLLMSDKAIQSIGPLDEDYAPLYMDDVEWCARARANSWYVFALLGGVVNQSETMSNASEPQNKIYKDAYERNTLKFYSDYEVQESQNQLRINRSVWISKRAPLSTRLKLLIIPEVRGIPQKLRIYIYRKYPKAARILQSFKHALMHN